MLKLLASVLAVLLVASSLSAQAPSGAAVTFSSQGETNGPIILQGGPNDRPVRDTRPATGRSTIRGRITSDGGQPVRRATVRVTAPELRVPRIMLTDADGRYEFAELPAGRYSINASKTTFVSWSYGQTQPNIQARPLTLADSQRADNIDIRLPRGGVIAGHIIDEFGDPVPSARVTLMRQQFRQGQRMLTPGGNGAMTNDIGEYRLFGLAPGQYYVSAMPQQGGIIAGPAAFAAGALEGQEARNGYAPTFYPGTPDPTAAQKITLGIGQTVSEINIALLATRTATISGLAVDAEGRPMGGGFVQIMPRGGMTGLGGPGGPLRPDGTFSVPNVAPGAYLLRANSPRPLQASGQPPGPPEFSIAFVVVNGDDVTDVRLAPVVPVRITGRVSFDDQTAAQVLKPSTVRVLTLASTVGDAGIGVGSGGSPLPVNDDFTFDLKTTPGQMGIRALVPGWQVKAIRVNGTDVTDSPLDVGSQGVSGVEIEMTNRLQEVSGTVTDADGKPVADYAVVVFAQDRSRWVASFNRYGATVRPGADGRFKLVTLPAGDYYAIALDRSDAIEGQDPEFLEGLTRLATTVSLASGDTRTLELKLFTVQ
jgi:protocatechuate 3,4-dioxygenase beta subunit